MAKQNQTLFRRLTRLFRSGPIVKRKIRALDTAIAVPDKTKSSGTLLFQKSLAPTYATITANAYNLSERLMRYQDFQEMEYTPEIAAALDIYADEACLSGDSIVPLLDGSKPTILELFQDGREGFWTYSYDIKLNRVVPGQATRVVKTGTKRLFKINLDDGTSLRLTDNHRVLLSNGTYTRVDNLSIGSSLRSLYTKISDKNLGDHIDGYEQILESDGWKYTHRMVSEFGEPQSKGIVHHIDFNKRNNEPSNLRFMSRKDHQILHAKTNTQRWLLTPGYAAKMSSIFSATAKRSHARPGFTQNLLRLRDAKFSTYDQKTRKKLFGRIGNKNGMFQKGTLISANKNGRWNPLFVRSVSRDQIISWINSGKTAQDVCAELPIRFEDLQSSMRNAGIVKWSQKHIVDANSIMAQFSSWREQQPANVKLHRLFSYARKYAGISMHQAYLALNASGYSSWSDFLNKTNHRVVSIIEDGIEDVFDLEVKNWHNFAVTAFSDSKSFVFVHNCAQDDKGRVLHVFSENEKIKEVLEDLFYNTLNVEFNMRSWVRNLCKYGDFFLYNDVSPEYGVVNAFPIPVNEVEREENYDREDPFAVRFRWVTLGNRVLENWEVSHFRLLGNDMFLPYGSSIIEPARRIWRQLILIEDAMLVYRVVRAPERRVFYIDVANIPPNDVPTYLEEQKKNLRSSQVIDKNTGRVDLRYNPLSVDEDYFIPVRGGDTGTKIDTLAGGQNTAAVEDVAYIQKKLFAALKIPRAYLGYDDMLSSKATLAQEDIRFSRTINVIQKVILAELNKLAIIHLYAAGFSDDDLVDFTLRLSNPSTVAQQQKLEIWRAKFEIAGSMPEGMGSKRFIYKNIWDINDDDIDELNRDQLKEALIAAKLEALGAGEAGGSGGGGGGGGVDLLGGGGDTGGGGEDELGGGDESTGGAEEAPPEPENAGEEPAEEEEPETELLTSGDDIEDDETFSLPSVKDDVSPVKVQSQLKRVLYNNSRKRTHGASKTHMPDFAKMTGIDNEAMRDPYDQNWLDSVISNPMGEGHQRSKIVHKPSMTPDVLSSLRGLAKKTPAPSMVMSEDVTFEDMDNLLHESFVNAEHEDVVIADDDDDSDGELL
jgi:hypothetical protein